MFSRFSFPVHLAMALFAATLLSACTATREAKQSREVSLESCQLSAPGQTERLDAKCGKLSVFENRESRTGRKIGIHFAVLPATGRKTVPDPLFMLAGGPGQAATEAFIQTLAAFSRINQERDIVLLDQRGTGRSNPLRCPRVNPQTSLNLDRAVALLSACQKTLKADLKLYTTPVAMADLDAVRAALGYEQINLYGGSYGTRAALVYLRSYPNRVRTAILDGVVPTDWNLGQTAARDAERALDLAFQRCAAEQSCAAAFTRLRPEFQALLSRLERQPVKTATNDPLTDRPLTVTVSRDTLTSTVRLLSYAPETVTLLPLLIHSTYLSNDFRQLAAQSQLAVGTFSQGFSDGMYYSVVCAEDAPFIKPDSGKGTYLGSLGTELFIKGCRSWPRAPLPVGYKDPVRSDVPVLLLSGEADPVTPPANAALAARTLPNSLQVVVPGQGHIVAIRGCIPLVLNSFLKKGSVKGLETNCSREARALPFFIDPSGPAP